MVFAVVPEPSGGLVKRGGCSGRRVKANVIALESFHEGLADAGAVRAGDQREAGQQVELGCKAAAHKLCRATRRRAASRDFWASASAGTVICENLVRGAQAVLRRLAGRDTPIGRWLRGLLAGRYKTVVSAAATHEPGSGLRGLPAVEVRCPKKWSGGAPT